MNDAPPSPLLAAHGLAFARNEVPVFGPLDFAVDAGEALLVQGGNGSGKTTLLRVLAGLLRADAGRVEIDGRPSRQSCLTQVRDGMLIQRQEGASGLNMQSAEN